MLIATWFVSDTASEATFFPQIGRSSSGVVAQKIYWRCILAFYATSLSHNRNFPHALFTNASPPVIDGIDLKKVLDRWGVELIDLPITHRLSKSRVQEWGNQFYILDILNYIAETKRWPSCIILDADVVWTSKADDIRRSIERFGVLTYVHDLDAYAEGQPINGVTRKQLARFASAHDTKEHQTLVYCGGEIYAATLEETISVAERAQRLWLDLIRGDGELPREEAHLLSVIYAIHGYQLGTADQYIKRMWTTLKHNTVVPSDFNLTLWHLPAEKRTGFNDLFDYMQKRGVAIASNGPSDLQITRDRLGQIFGIPRRTIRNLLRYMNSKLNQKLMEYI